MNFPRNSCRVCLERFTDALIPLTEKLSQEYTVSELIQFVTGLSTTTESGIDIYPQFLCIYCLRMLEVAFKVKGTFLYSNYVMRSSGIQENVRTQAETPSPPEEKDSSSSISPEINQQDGMEKLHCSSTDSVASKEDPVKNETFRSPSEVTYICKKCSVDFVTLDELNQHCASKHKKRIRKRAENVCSVCSEILPSRTDMIQHKKLQHPDLWTQNPCDFW